MKNIILFEDSNREAFLPLSYTRPIAEFKLGILTIAQKWEKWLNGRISYITQDYLAKKYPINITEDNYVVNASVLPNNKIAQLIDNLALNEAFLHDNQLIAVRLDDKQFEKLLNEESIEELKGTDLSNETYVDRINHLWDIFQRNEQQIKSDFDLLTRGRSSQPISKTNTILGDGQIFLEEGAKVEAAVLNTTNGPIYLGEDAEIMEGALVRGPFSMGPRSVLKMGAKIYEGTSLGTYCKVGGEVSNAVFFDYSNKGHDGFLGNSVIGSWCNIGADTNTSNLKNNYAEVKLWNYVSEKFELTGTQFCGLIMGDHSKVGINVMFNTGTVVGCNTNIFGSGFPRNFIPSFSMGGTSSYKTFNIEKTFELADAVMSRRDKALSEIDKSIMEYIYNHSSVYRRWEKK